MHLNCVGKEQYFKLSRDIFQLKGLSRFIYPQKHKQEYGKSPQRRPPIAKEWQGDANNGGQS